MEISLLGPVEVRHGGHRLDLGRRQERCVLGLLLLEPGRVVATERILNLLWDDPPPTARAALHTYIARLRARLAPYDLRLVTRGAGYLAEVDPQAIDVHRFTTQVARAQRLTEPAERAAALRAALRLWRGPLLADVADDRLRGRLSAHLDEVRLTALECAAEAELATGAHHQVLTALAELVAEHPTREHLTGLLMLALYRSGRQTDALAAYRRLRALLVEEFGVEPGAELRRIHQRILREDPALALAPELELEPGPAGRPTARGRHTIGARRFLPRDIPDFTGRVAELARLDALADAGRDTATAVLITNIAGAPGVGKTALAVRWAHRATGRYPDGQFYIDLRGYHAEPPVRAAEALTRLLRALDVPAERIPADEDEAAALYRSVLADRPVLVLLDNARSVNQVRPLLPSSPRSLALITSREGLAGLVARDGARRLPLAELPPADATDLLSRILGAERVTAEPHAAALLAAACGHLPLALRIAATHLGEQSGRSIADYVAELATSDKLDMLVVDGDPQGTLRTAFDQSYRSLPAAQQRLFRLLGNADAGDITVPAAAALARTSQVRTARLLHRLADAHLLTEPTPGRYAMHDLLRRYAASQGIRSVIG